MNTVEYLKMEGREEGRLEGRVEGRTEKEINVVRNLLVTPDFSDERIAAVVGVTTDFVKEVRQGERNNA